MAPITPARFTSATSISGRSARTSGSSIVLSVGEVGGDSVFYPYITLYGPNGALVTYAASTHVAQISCDRDR